MLTPEEIAERRFLVSLRGYDRDEVHAFLGHLARQMADLQQRNAELSQEVERVTTASPRPQPAPGAEGEQRLEEAAPATAPSPDDPRRPFAEIGEETQRILEAAQEAGSRITRKARHDADRELQAARQRAAKVIADGERRREATEAVVTRLEERRTAIAGELRSVGQAIERAVGELVPDDDAPTVREALTAVVDEPPPSSGLPEGPVEASALDDDDADDADEAPTPEGAVVVEPPDAPDAAAAADEHDDDAIVATPVDAPGTEEPSGPGGLRASALEPVHPKMVRRVKRGLSDLQNISLDRLRREGHKATAEALELSRDELATLGQAADEFLDLAYQAGRDAAAVLAGRRLPGPDGPPALGEPFLDDAGARIREPLSATLRMGLSSDEPVTALNDRVGAVFSELKSAAADELSATHLIRAYELGLLDAWAAGGVTHRIWVLGREPRCPEGRCRQNDQSGAVDVTDPFPSGHVAPPVHVGCTCTTIPALES